MIFQPSAIERFEKPLDVEAEITFLALPQSFTPASQLKDTAAQSESSVFPSEQTEPTDVLPVESTDRIVLPDASLDEQKCVEPCQSFPRSFDEIENRLELDEYKSVVCITCTFMVDINYSLNLFVMLLIGL